jgi:hypothetical protein
MFLPPAPLNSLMYSTVKSKVAGKFGNAPFSKTLPAFRSNEKLNGTSCTTGEALLKSSKYAVGAPVDPASWPEFTDNFAQRNVQITFSTVCYPEGFDFCTLPAGSGENYAGLFTVHLPHGAGGVKAGDTITSCKVRSGYCTVERAVAEFARHRQPLARRRTEAVRDSHPIRSRRCWGLPDSTRRAAEKTVVAQHAIAPAF